MIFRTLTALAVSASITVAASAADPRGPCDAPLPESLVADGEENVQAVLDGQTILLESGQQVRLVGLQVPVPESDDAHETQVRLAVEARDALARAVSSRAVALHHDGRRADRYGRALAQVVRVDDGLWIQGYLLCRGLARVHSFGDNRTAVVAMLAVERAARLSQAGLWAEPEFWILSADRAAVGLHDFGLVEGRVHSVAIVRGRAYLNFGADWRTDFTVAIAPKERRLFEAEGRSIEGYRGRFVRVRGWIKSFNGPMIEVTHPEQIEVLE